MFGTLFIKQTPSFQPINHITCFKTSIFSSIIWTILFKACAKSKSILFVYASQVGTMLRALTIYWWPDYVYVNCFLLQQKQPGCFEQRWIAAEFRWLNSKIYDHSKLREVRSFPSYICCYDDKLLMFLQYLIGWKPVEYHTIIMNVFNDFLIYLVSFFCRLATQLQPI